MTVLHQILHAIGWPFRMVLIGVIRGYQKYVSPMFGPPVGSTRRVRSTAWTPCGGTRAAKGTLLTSARLLRCNPWTKGGIDPVPEVGKVAARRDAGRIAAH